MRQGFLLYYCTILDMLNLTGQHLFEKVSQGYSYDICGNAHESVEMDGVDLSEIIKPMFSPRTCRERTSHTAAVNVVFNRAAALPLTFLSWLATCHTVTVNELSILVTRRQKIVWTQLQKHNHWFFESISLSTRKRMFFHTSLHLHVLKSGWDGAYLFSKICKLHVVMSHRVSHLFILPNSESWSIFIVNFI